MVHWFGPRDFKSTVLKNELRQAALIESTCSGLTATIGRRGVYREIVPPKRLVMVGAGLMRTVIRPSETVLTLTFEEHGEKTKLRLHQTGFESGHRARRA